MYWKTLASVTLATNTGYCPSCSDEAGSEALSSLQPAPLTGGDLSLLCLLTALGLILTGIS